MRVARLIIYDGPDADVEQQLSASTPDGVRLCRKTVTMRVMTLPLGFLHALEESGQRLIEAVHLDGERIPPVIGTK